MVRNRDLGKRQVARTDRWQSAGPATLHAGAERQIQHHHPAGKQFAPRWFNSPALTARIPTRATASLPYYHRARLCLIRWCTEVWLTFPGPTPVNCAGWPDCLEKMAYCKNRYSPQMMKLFSGTRTLRAPWFPRQLPITDSAQWPLSQEYPLILMRQFFKSLQIPKRKQVLGYPILRDFWRHFAQKTNRLHIVLLLIGSSNRRRIRCPRFTRREE